MPNELKATVINLKSLSQNIPDPVIVGAGDANGRTLRIIFSQEAAAQLTEDTKVYLSWYHQEIDVKGYNVFTKINDDEDENFPPTWEIKYPKSMLYEGNVLACIQLVDSVSIATSTNFIIHVLMDPNDGSRYTATDDFSEFQRTVIYMTTLSNEMKRQMENQKIEFEDMQIEFMDIRNIVTESENISTQAQEIAEQSLQTAQSALNTIVDLTDLAREARNTAQEVKDQTSVLNLQIKEINSRIERDENIVEAINEVAQSALEIARVIEERGCCGEGITEQQLNEAIANAKEELNTIIQETKTDLQAQIKAIPQDFTAQIEQVKEDILSILTIMDFT